MCELYEVDHLKADYSSLREAHLIGVDYGVLDSWSYTGVVVFTEKVNRSTSYNMSGIPVKRLGEEEVTASTYKPVMIVECGARLAT